MSSKKCSVSVRPMGRSLQTNTPELMPPGTEMFSTPRPTQSSKKIIHKEKLSTVRYSGALGKDGGTRPNMQAASEGVSRVDTIPTAHVSPHPAATSRAPPSALLFTQPALDISNLRRTASTSNFTDLPHTLGGIDNHHVAAAKRWNSYQHLAPGETPASSDFSELPPNTDITFNESHIPEPDYTKDKVKAATAPTTSEMPYRDPLRLAGVSSTLQASPGYTYDGPAHTYSTPASALSYKPARYHSPSAYQTPQPATIPSNEYNKGFSLAPTGSIPNGRINSDITSWQKKHQDDLMVQRYEATRPVVYSGVETIAKPAYMDPHRLDAVKDAADNIIHEKDKIIEKQRARIRQLELRIGESEFDLHNAHRHQTEEGTALSIQLQESQYEIARLKAHITESMSGDIEKRLGGTEYELREVKQALEKERQQRSIDRKSMQELLSKKDGTIDGWRDKYNIMLSEKDLLEKKMDGMGRYLGDLPTMDDHAKRENEIRQLEKDKSKYKARAIELERRLTEASKAMKQRQELVDSLKDADNDSQENIKCLQAENSRLRASLGIGDDGEVPPSVHEQLDELRYDNERLKAEMEKARKLLEAKHKKQQSIEVRHRGEVKELEERLGQEESTVAGLKEQILSKDQLVKKLRESIKELGSQNQDLMESKLSLEEHQRELEKKLTGEAHKLECRLLKEMAVCFAELQSLVQICVQRAEGEDPNISVLLGAKGVLNLEPDEALPVGDNVQSLKYKVSKIHDLRKDIDNLRDIISNKYAEDMGENLNCTTQ